MEDQRPSSLLCWVTSKGPYLQCPGEGGPLGLCSQVSPQPLPCAALPARGAPRRRRLPGDASQPRCPARDWDRAARQSRAARGRARRAGTGPAPPYRQHRSGQRGGTLGTEQPPPSRSHRLPWRGQLPWRCPPVPFSVAPELNTRRPSERAGTARPRLQARPPRGAAVMRAECGAGATGGDGEGDDLWQAPLSPTGGGECRLSRPPPASA